MSVSNVFGPLDAAHGFVDPFPSVDAIRVCALLYGAFLGVAAAVLLFVIKSTRFDEKPFRWNFFKTLIWLQWLCVVPFGTIEWLRFEHKISPSFAYYFFDILLWSIQTHCLTQIVANRVGILVNSRKTRLIVKWSVFVAVCILNVLTFCSWGAAALQTDNLVIYKILIPFSLVVMCGLMVIDVLLNAWFVYNIRRRLTNLGMTKYNRLVYVNLVFLACEVGLDATIVGCIWLTNKSIYLMIYPLCYVIKLAIELSLSALIVKIASENPVKRINQQTISQLSDHFGNSVQIKTECVVQSEKAGARSNTPVAFGQFIQKPAFTETNSEIDYLPHVYSAAVTDSTHSRSSSNDTYV